MKFDTFDRVDMLRFNLTIVQDNGQSSLQTQSKNKV